MHPVSAEYKAAVIKSHVIANVVDVLNYAGDTLAPVPILEGNLDVSKTDPWRRQFRFSFLDDTGGTYIPDDDDDLLSPLSNNRVRPLRGIQLPTGPEMCKLGLFDIAQVTTDDSGENLRVSVYCVDFARRVGRAKLTEPYTISAGTNVGEAIWDLISSRVDGLQHDFDETVFTTPLINLNEGADPWEQAQSMATSIGCELYFDLDGVLVLRDIPEPNDMEVATTYVEGESCTVLYINRSLNNDRTFNHIVVIGGSTSSAVVRGEAKDTDRSSPTYWDGPYGDVPNIIRDGLITSTDQANRRARAELLLTLGWTESLTMSAVPNPALEAGDLIYLQRTKSTVSGYFVIDNLNMPVGPTGAHQITVKRVRRG